MVRIWARVILRDLIQFQGSVRIHIPEQSRGIEGIKLIEIHFRYLADVSAGASACCLTPTRWLMSWLIQYRISGRHIVKIMGAGVCIVGISYKTNVTAVQ